MNRVKQAATQSILTWFCVFTSYVNTRQDSLGVALSRTPAQFRSSPGVSHVPVDISAAGKLVSVHYNHISIYFCLTGCWCHNDTEHPPRQRCHPVSLHAAWRCWASETNNIIVTNVDAITQKQRQSSSQEALWLARFIHQDAEYKDINGMNKPAELTITGIFVV